MGRAERRRLERKKRIEERKEKVLLSRSEISRLKQDITSAATSYGTEALMTCFALAEHRLYGFGATRIFRSLSYIDELMGPIIEGEKTIEDYKKELETETGVKIEC